MKKIFIDVNKKIIDSIFNIAEDCVDEALDTLIDKYGVAKAELKSKAKKKLGVESKKSKDKKKSKNKKYGGYDMCDLKSIVTKL